MEKKPRGRPSTKKKESVVQNSEQLSNGLQDAIFGYNPGVPGAFTAPLSQVDTVFVNLRWYFISNMRQPLNQAYSELGLIRTIVDVPVDDAFRGGIDVKTKELSAEELEHLHYTMEEKNDLGKQSQAQKWDRLFGGAGVLIITGDEWETPFDINLLKKGDPVEFRAVDMWELFWDEQNISGDGTPVMNTDFEYYRYYGKNVHRSRVMVTHGIEAPSFVRPRLRGWGLSVVETAIRSVNQYLKATDLTFEVLDEFKIDVYKIKNLTNTLLTASGTAQIQRRIQLANLQKNYQNAISMDSEDDYIQKELTFAGLAETMAGIRMQVASELRMPMSKLFGIASTGFSSGEDDLENYHGMIESTIRTPAKFHLFNLVKIRCQSLFGFVPEDLKIGFKSLRILSAEQEENVKTQKFNRTLGAYQSGLITSKQFLDACNRDELLPVQIDTSEVDDIDLSRPDPEVNDDMEVPDKKGKKSVTTAPEAKT